MRIKSQSCQTKCRHTPWAVVVLHFVEPVFSYLNGCKPPEVTVLLVFNWPKVHLFFRHTTGRKIRIMSSPWSRQRMSNIALKRLWSGHTQTNSIPPKSHITKLLLRRPTACFPPLPKRSSFLRRGNFLTSGMHNRHTLHNAGGHNLTFLIHFNT